MLPNNKLAKTNLKLAFPQKNQKEIEVMTKNVWGNMARTLGEYLFLTHRLNVDLECPEKSDVEVVGFEILEKIKKQNRPTIFFSAHIGNWELLPVGAAYYGVDIGVPFTMPKNPYIAKILMNTRSYGGDMIQSQFGAAWEMAEKLKENKTIGVLADQRYKRKGAQKIKFFGRDATANPTIVKLAKQFDCPIYPARCIRTGEGKFKIEVFPEISMIKDENGEINVEKNTEYIQNIIESWVREYPEQWMWPYDRWK